MNNQEQSKQPLSYDRLKELLQKTITELENVGKYDVLIGTVSANRIGIKTYEYRKLWED